MSACKCETKLNGITDTTPVMDVCIKLEGGRRACTPKTGGGCSSDQRSCWSEKYGICRDGVDINGKDIDSSGKWAFRKCAKKLRKQKCKKKKVRKHCRFTCNVNC